VVVCIVYCTREYLTDLQVHFICVPASSEHSERSVPVNAHNVERDEMRVLVYSVAIC
jgi:hypothetical protein